ncbi:MAG: toll/interleukin-1 receptor domain-containing protein [Blastocatellia bacterium]
MANPEHLEIIEQGVEKWNQWRKENPHIKPDLFYANLTSADLSGANLTDAQLSAARLIQVNLTGADLSGVELIGADLITTDLSGASLSGALIEGATFANVDLSEVIGLEMCTHLGPSTIGIDTIYKSHGKIPEEFLRGCGVDENLIRFIPSLVGSVQPFQLYSCFISYSTKDDEFAKRLHSRLRDAKARVWFSPEDVKGGEKLFDQIERAIQLHDRLLLVLSEESLKSGWVETEIRKAIETEKREGRRKLFPIRITDFETIKKWRCFDADTGKDLAVEVREYFIPDFSDWKDHDSFEAAFDRLLRDLKAEEQSPASKL